jgi:hypothetical protein
MISLSVILGSPPPGYLSEDGDSQAIGLWIVLQVV